ncbi:hypothetical protein BBJ28_00009979 [Nothophytophthora sp. Chile5]|nr:hypothetical protein BBJ28_00009979 [Nothophytophthora sp. Chile5]
MVLVTPSKGLSVDALACTEMADLATLQVNVGELRLTADGTWLYVLQVSCGSARWQVSKRYREIRALWIALGTCLSAASATSSCTEHCHFLSGLEHDKFPKKRLLHTQHALETRAAELHVFFLKLAMRLNLCSPTELECCRLRGCPVLALVSGFFQTGKPLIGTASCRSISLERHSQSYDQQFSKKRRGSSSRRFSFGFADRSSTSVVAAVAK